MTSIVAGIYQRRREREIATYGHELTEEQRFEIEQEEERKQIAQQNARKSQEQAEWLKKQISELPLRFRNKTFANYHAETKAQRDIVTHLQKGFSAVIYGGNGVGKTHLAFAAIRHQLEQGISSRYVLAFDFFMEIKRSFRDDSTASVLKSYASAGYLIIDEVDKAFGSQTEFVYLYSLVNSRYNQMLPTVLITNAGESELIEVIGSSTLSRVAGDGALIEIKGKDWRQHHD